MNITDLGTILGVWAHPDDEAFLAAGLLAMAADAGQHVACVTATRGELGTSTPELWTPERLGRLRAWELSASLSILGVREHRWLGHRDGACAAVDPRQGSEEVARVIDETRPDTIVTFGPEGFTGHPDHAAVSHWTTLARQRANPRARLLHVVPTDNFATRFDDLNRSFNVFVGGPPTTYPISGLDLHLHLTDDVVDRKVAALRAHASQTSQLFHAAGEERFHQWWREEAFVAACAVPAARAAA